MGMTLEEAVKHAEEVMMENLEKTKGRNASDPTAIKCGECAEEHRQLAEWLKELKQLREQTRWIPVSERLPEANGRYLVTRGLNACGSMWNRVYIINYSDLMGLKSERVWWDGNVGKSDFKRIDDVVAWMPLPKSYKESEDKK